MMRLELFELGGVPIGINFYGAMYALTFLSAYYLLSRDNRWNPRGLERSAILLMIGVVLGGRLGYIFFYNLDYYIQYPAKIFAFYEGGMSFHGGLIGVVIMTGLIAATLPKKDYLSYLPSFRERFLSLLDSLAIITPIGLTLGRFGNYLNQELLGYAGYTGIFAVEKNGISYFPAPLLEMTLEGIVLGLILIGVASWQRRHNKQSPGSLALLFIVGYSLARFAAEFVRTPDAHIGYIAWGWLTLGQILTVAIGLSGVLLITFITHCSYAHSRK